MDYNARLLLETYFKLQLAEELALCLWTENGSVYIVTLFGGGDTDTHRRRITRGYKSGQTEMFYHLRPGCATVDGESYQGRAGYCVLKNRLGVFDRATGRLLRGSSKIQKFEPLPTRFHLTN